MQTTLIHALAFLIGFTWGLVIMALIKYLRIKPVNIYIGKDIPVVQETPRKPIFKPKEPKETEEQRKQRILLENIERYDGTGKGQVKI
jgi:ABC-type amino acid transport system permease subunit